MRVEVWDGDVIVRALMLEQVWDLAARSKADPDGFAEVPETLAIAVLDADHEPVLDVAGWKAFSAVDRKATTDLFNAVHDLSHPSAEAVEKN